MAESSGKHQPDQRKYQRFGSVKAAQIEYEGASAPVSVKIIDMSAAGARLETSSSVSLPETFQLIVSPQGGETRKTVNCRLRWQRNCQLGVTFF